MNKDRTYGLLLKSDIDQGTRRVTVELIGRDPGKDYPVGNSDSYLHDSDRPKHLLGHAIDGLGLFGFVSDLNDWSYIGYEAEFRSFYSVDQSKAAGMVKTLKRVNAAIHKSLAYEPGDKMIALATALKLEFVVERRTNQRGPCFGDNDWNWMTVEEGRNRYRNLIREQCEAARAANPQKVLA